MLYSKLFTRTKKEAPKDELTINAKLLIRAGFVNKLMAGAYTILPLGLRVLRKIENIVREEMEAINGQELLMPALQPSENWKKTGGWNSIDVLFKVKSRTDKDYALGQSHEEVITPLVKEYVSSYKDLPLFVFQIQNKFRDELRAKSGILRGREFGMKDLYSFHRDQRDFDKFYEVMKKAYMRVFSRCSLEVKATEASGGSFSKKISYEFMVLTEAGEDDILFCSKCDYCINTEIAKIKEGDKCPKCQNTLKKGKASEVGNVFDLGQKYAKDFDFKLADEKGEAFYPTMGCYGIGTTRLMGVIVEKHSDKKGIIWPKSVTPFSAHLIGVENEEKANEVYEGLKKQGIDVLYDDRSEVSAGEKFADADLIGIPLRIVVSNKSLKKGGVELKKRDSEKTEVVAVEKIKEFI